MDVREQQARLEAVGLEFHRRGRALFRLRELLQLKQRVGQLKIGLPGVGIDFDGLARGFGGIGVPPVARAKQRQDVVCPRGRSLLTSMDLRSACSEFTVSFRFMYAMPICAYAS